MDGRSRRLRGYDCLDESWTRLCKRPAVLARLRMDQIDRWADAIKQSRKGVDIHLRLSFAVVHRRNVGSDIIVEGRIARLRIAWPLRVEFRLRPQIVFFTRGESLHRVFARLHPRRTIDINDVG